MNSDPTLGFHKPGENPQIDEILMSEHLKVTGSKVQTRFPPEPNGFLHIGHAKAINFNFTYAKNNGGTCCLRFDDTNPEAEEQIYFDSIVEIVNWLGFTPDRITATSDYFQQLYDLAIKMIESGHAYVCHQTPEELHASRGGNNHGNRTESPWRNRPVEESLKLFMEMKNGLIAEGSATLRLKIDISSGNPYMWDPIAYRILNKPHVRTGSAWCIYPSYDFSHCLTDSMENITHSFCTTEFSLAREAYYWICDKAHVYKPVQWEYGRLNITNTVLSKRKLKQLVEGGHVSGWSDPRLYTLIALKRRGVPAKAINNFVEKIGVTTSQTIIDVKVLEACVREELNVTSPRCKAIVKPLKVTLINYNGTESIVYPRHPMNPSMGESTVSFSQHLFIDADDFMEVPTKDFKRLSPGKSVGLQRAYVITCKEVVKNESGEIIELKCECDTNKTIKAKIFIHWIDQVSAIPITINMYKPLFCSSNPDANGFLADLNPNSLEVIKGLIDESIGTPAIGLVYQFERVGYFCLDNDSTDGNQIWNLTVSLKEDSKK